MKASTLLIGSLLLMAAACAASLGVDQSHVFEGEEFTVTYTASAPISQQKVSIAFADQTKDINLGKMTLGTFSTSVSFNAPQKGTYEIVSGEAKTEVVVEPSLLVLEDVRIHPGSIPPGETTELSYTIRNAGEEQVYNVKRKVTVASDAFTYNAQEDLLHKIMSPGTSLHEVKQIVARGSASGSARAQVLVTYEYDGELHTREEWVSVNVSSMNSGMVIAAVLVVAVALFVFSKAKRHSE